MIKQCISLMLGSCLLLGYQHARAQIYVNGTNFSNYGYISNYGTYTEVTAAAGSSYDAAFGAIFDHFETDANTLRVSNAYNANGSGGSTDNFNGPLGAAGVQGVSGSVAPNFSTLVLKNGATSLFNITNTAGANIFTTADFQNGITTTIRANTMAGALRFEAGATYTGGSTDAQHVDGYVSKIGKTAFVFPVGTANDVRTLSINAPANATAHLSVAYETSIAEATTVVSTPITRVFTTGSWDWIPVVPSSSALTVTVSIPNVTSFEATASNLRLLGWDGSQWIDLSGSPNASGVAENSTLTGTVPGGAGANITQIGIGSIATAAPDLSPNLTVLPSVLLGVSSLTLNIKVLELNKVATTGSLITVNVKSGANWTTNLVPGNLVNGWTYVGLVGTNHRFTSNIILNNSFSEFNIPASFNPGGTTGQYVFTVGISSGSGGETIATNNADQETVSYEP